jgi:hypothetical protein
MYVEAICPLCFASHVVPDDMRGETFRCEECEEQFVISRKAKRTNKKPPRPREVQAAEEEPAEVAPVDSAEVLPEAKLAGSKPKKTPSPKDEEVLDIPDDAVQGGAPVVKTAPASKRRREEDEIDRPKKSRRDEDEDDRPRKRRRDEDEDDDRPRRRTAARRSGAPVGLIVGISAGAVMLLGLVGIGAWWALSSKDTEAPAAGGGKDKGKVADNQNPKKTEEARKEPPRKDPPPLDPNRVDEPKKDPPKKEVPPPVGAPVAWTAKADPPATEVKLPADFKKEIPVPGGALAEAVYPATASPFVAIGSNRRAADERQVWDLRTGKMTGKVIGAVRSPQHPVLSPDGAHLAFLTATPTTAEVWALGPGKMSTIDLGGNVGPFDVFDFAGPGKLLIGRQAAANQMTVRVLDAATGKQEQEFTTIRPFGQAHETYAVSPGGAYLALVDLNNLWVYDIKTGTAVGQRALPKKPGTAPICHGLSFSPDGSEIAGLFVAGFEAQLVCWDAGKGEVVSEIADPQGRPDGNAGMVYRGHTIDWVGDRRGWLLYGYKLADRKNGTVTALPKPVVPGGTAARHMIGPDHAVTLANGTNPGEKLLTVSKFDPDKPQ